MVKTSLHYFKSHNFIISPEIHIIKVNAVSHKKWFTFTFSIHIIVVIGCFY